MEFRCMFYCYNIFLCRILVKNKKNFLDILLIKGKKAYFYFIFLLIINVVTGKLCTIISGRGLEMSEGVYGNPILTYVSAFAGIGCVLIISNLLYSKVIEYIGRNSLIYYSWHQNILIPIIYFMYKKFEIFTSRSIYILSIKTIVSLLLICIVCTFLNKIIVSSKLRFMVGKFY